MRKIVLLLLMTGIIAIPAGVAAAPSASSGCQNIKGTFVVQAVPTAVGFDVYPVHITGPLVGHPIGTKLTTVVVEYVTPGGTIHLTSVHEFAGSAFGPMKTIDKGVITPSGKGQNHITIVEGASGFIFVHGDVDLATGLITLWYHGHVCDD
jgi:hypothetical protein